MTIERGCRELLLAIVRDSTTPGDLRSLADSVSDWDQLVDLALQHQVLPMLSARLADLGPAMPTGVLARIRLEYDRIVLHNLANAAELIAVLQTFEREGIQAMPFKGVVLAASAYGDLLKRPGGDLDVLVRKRDLASGANVLRERGYELETLVLADGRPKDPKVHEYKFRRRSDGRELELRWRLDLNWGRYTRDLGIDWVWPQRATAMLAGAAVPVLNPNVSLLVLCMHGCKHDWSRLIWVCDVAKLIESSPKLDWHAVLEEAKRLGLTRAVGLGALLTRRLLNPSIPTFVLELFERDETTRRLADHFAINLIDNPGMGPSGRVPHGFQLLDFRDRLRLILSLDFLRPNERDRSVIDLPRWLCPLYYLLRPLRLMTDRSAR
jgi:hypothetical protein